MQRKAVSNLSGFVNRLWSRKGLLNFFLLPFALLFGVLTRVRRWLYQAGWFYSSHPGVPVIVAGNLNAGGSGKTPFVIETVRWLRSEGYCPGVVSRGYGRKRRDVMCVLSDAHAEDVGDEPLLIHQKTGVPVVVGTDRLQAARRLLAEYPGVDVIVSDDGLQHYRLRRDVELVLADAQTRFGNGWLMPAGPLRESISRLKQTDALILSGEASSGSTANLPAGITVFAVSRAFGGFRRLNDSAVQDRLPKSPQQEIQAVAGIARPEGFFRTLREMGIPFRARPFPDHYTYTAQDFDPDATVVMTEKDAVKCTRYAGPHWWALQLRTVLPTDFTDWLRSRLAGKGK